MKWIKTHQYEDKIIPKDPCLLASYFMMSVAVHASLLACCSFQHPKHVLIFSTPSPIFQANIPSPLFTLSSSPLPLPPSAPPPFFSQHKKTLKKTKQTIHKTTEQQNKKLCNLPFSLTTHNCSHSIPDCFPWGQWQWDHNDVGISATLLPLRYLSHSPPALPSFLPSHSFKNPLPFQTDTTLGVMCFKCVSSVVSNPLHVNFEHWLFLSICLMICHWWWDSFRKPLKAFLLFKI